jgi:microcystin-dependent protein
MPRLAGMAVSAALSTVTKREQREEEQSMSVPFLGELRIFSFSFAPKGHALCNGQLMPINQNQALFSLLGTTYGGDGQTTFALPDLRGRIPVHTATGFVQGQQAGEETHTLITTEMPAHTHVLSGNAANGTLPTPANNFWAGSAANPYVQTPDGSTMNPQDISNAGGGQPHDNMPPYLVLSFCIALVGIFPSRN